MQIKIRKAKKPDLEKIVKLQKEQNLLHQKFDHKFYTPSDDYTNEWKKVAKEKLKNRKCFLSVAIDSNKIVGFIQGDIRIRGLRKIKEYGHVTEIFVKNKYRGKSIGTSLMVELVRWFKSKKIKYVELGVNSKNKNAIKFYKKLGYKEYEKTMKRDI